MLGYTPPEPKFWKALLTAAPLCSVRRLDGPAIPHWRKYCTATTNALNSPGKPRHAGSLNARFLLVDAPISQFLSRL